MQATGQASRELDGRVHVEVMDRRLPTTIPLDDSVVSGLTVPCYSTDIAAAMLVVERILKLTPQGGDIHIEKLGGTDWKISCCFSKDQGGWDGWVGAATLPLAICRAALRVVSND